MAAPPISLKLRCASWKQLAAIYERDLARGAVFLKSAAPPPLGTKVRINLTLPTQTLIVLNGSVDRHVAEGELNARGPGVDIKLHNVPQSAIWLIESTLEAASRKGAITPATPTKQIQAAASAEELVDMETDPGEELVEAQDLDAAYARLDAGDLEEALRLFQLASQRNRGDRTARMGLELARGLEALGDGDRLEAAQRFEAVLELDPGNERATRELANMRGQATSERKSSFSRPLDRKK